MDFDPGISVHVKGYYVSCCIALDHQIDKIQNAEVLICVSSLSLDLSTTLSLSLPWIYSGGITVKK